MGQVGEDNEHKRKQLLLTHGGTMEVIFKFLEWDFFKGAQQVDLFVCSFVCSTLQCITMNWLVIMFTTALYCVESKLLSCLT